MNVAVGCDHRGLRLKQAIVGLLTELGHAYHDFGCYSSEPVDYPDIVQVVTGGVVSGEFDHGILICSTGIGMSMAANKVKGIRAALCCSTFSAQRARLHNDANILCLGDETTDKSLALDIVKSYFSAAFEGGRHLRRLEKMHNLEAA